jgi:6-phosphogluconolactonase (cycloisomerase 2 family)
MGKTIGTVFLLLVLTMNPQSAQRKPARTPQLVSVEPLEMCATFPAPAVESGEVAGPLLAELRQDRIQIARADVPTAKTLERAPLRTIRDSFPTYSAVAVDAANNEIVLQDENLFQIMVYDRMANTPPNASFTEPKRIISGHDTKLEFNCGLYIDPKTGDIYSVNNDTLDTLSIFSRKASGNSKPDRTLHTPHGTYGIAVNEETQELFLTIQHENEVVVNRKMAQGQDKPLRVLAGPHVRLADPHGIGIDTKNQWMFVANYGNAHESKVPGSGTFVPPSINVYPLKASGDTPPLRVITGPKTQLNWPAHVYVDQEHGDVFVANDGDSSILVFRVTDNGDVPPSRVLKGAKTQIKNPTGIFVDTAHDELVVANMGNHSATVYPRAADGDTPPVRTIRTAPPGKGALQIGNPGSVAYDTKRDAIITPN